MINLLPYPSALEELNKLLPTCHSLTPDPISDSAKKMGLSVMFVPLENWESMSDDQIFQTILPAQMGADEPIIVVTDASFCKASPFSFRGNEFSEFVRFHFDNYHECVVNGDVVIIMPARRVLVLFHHEGYHATIDFNR